MKKIIINGGKSLEGCPRSDEEAKNWIDSANNNKDEEKEPTWKFDCGYKLDFDGILIEVSSRFYPPKSYYGNGWDGDVEFVLLGKTLKRKKFFAKSLNQLKTNVEKYIFEESQKLFKS